MQCVKQMGSKSERVQTVILLGYGVRTELRGGHLEVESGLGSKRTKQRFTRVSAKQILYRFEVDDPATYSQVWKAEMPLNSAPGPVYEYACHEGNYALPGILAGARKADKEGKTIEAVDVSG